MKLFIRFLLSLCLLLSGGYTSVHAGLQQGQRFHSSFSFPQRWHDAGHATTLHNQAPSLSYVRSAGEPESDHIYATEDEDENRDLIVFKKHAGHDHHYFTSFYTGSAADVSSYIKDRLPVREPSSGCSSPRYILFSVFRI